MPNNMVKLKINNIEVEVQKGTTILEAAKKIDIKIPTLCFLKDINEVGDCRMCIVEVEGRKNFVPSCIEKVQPGMVVYTNSKEVDKARKTILELILSYHNADCLTCTRDGNCELQSLAKKYNMQDIRFNGMKNTNKVDNSSITLIRDMNKCIMCKRCISMCNNVQNVGAINIAGRGFESRITTQNDRPITNTKCTNCGQCINVCPVGALREKEEIDYVYEALKNPNKKVIFQTAPAVRVALGEEFGYPIGTNVQGKMVSAIKKLGAYKVFDTNTAADFTIIEESAELINRIKHKRSTSNDNFMLPWMGKIYKNELSRNA